MDTIVVTRHPALVEYLKERGVIDNDVEVVDHATAEIVKGKHVIGVLPTHLAALTGKYTNVGLNVPKELRGEELTLEQVRQYASTPTDYEIRVLSK